MGNAKSLQNSTTQKLYSPTSLSTAKNNLSLENIQHRYNQIDIPTGFFFPPNLIKTLKDYLLFE